MKTDDQIKDIIRAAEQRLARLLAEQRAAHNDYIDRKAEEIRQRMRAELLTPEPGPLHGAPIVSLVHSLRTYDSESARAVGSVEIRTLCGPNYQLEFDDPRARAYDTISKPLKGGTRYAVVVSFYELPEGEP